MASECLRCGAPKNPKFFACSTCWFMLPQAVRDRIWRAYRRDGPLSEEWCAAAEEAYAAWQLPVPRWLEAAR